MKANALIFGIDHGINSGALAVIYLDIHLKPLRIELAQYKGAEELIMFQDWLSNSIKEYSAKEKYYFVEDTIINPKIGVTYNFCTLNDLVKDIMEEYHPIKRYSVTEWKHDLFSGLCDFKKHGKSKSPKPSSKMVDIITKEHLGITLDSSEYSEHERNALCIAIRGFNDVKKGIVR